MPKLSRITVPFTPEQVQSLNEYQASGHFHPFTCQNVGSRHPVLVAAADGWRCPSCEYKQDWAHEWMADGSWHRGAAELLTMGGLTRDGERKYPAMGAK